MLEINRKQCNYQMQKKDKKESRKLIKTKLQRQDEKSQVKKNYQPIKRTAQIMMMITVIK